MDTSNSSTGAASQVPKNFFTTNHSKAFLETHGTNYFKTFFDTSKNSRYNFTSQISPMLEESRQKDLPHIDVYFPSLGQQNQTPSEWYGTKLARQQAYQEQRVFAKRQRVRFGGCGGCSGASSNDHGDYDYDDDEDEDDNIDDGEGEKDHGEADTKQAWQFSQVAKSFAAKEQKLFKTMAGRCKRIDEEIEEEEFPSRGSDRRNGTRRD